MENLNEDLNLLGPAKNKTLSAKAALLLGLMVLIDANLNIWVNAYELVVWALERENELLRRVVVNPRVMAGKPVIRGTRVPVELILKLLAEGLSYDEILKDYPHLTMEDVKAALLYAAKVMGREEIYPLIME